MLQTLQIFYQFWSTRRFFFFTKYKNVSINPFQSSKTNILGTSICTRQVIIHKIHGRSRRTCTNKNVYEFMVKYRFLCNPVYCIVIKRAYYYQCVLHPSCTPSLSPPPLFFCCSISTPPCVVVVRILQRGRCLFLIVKVATPVSGSFAGDSMTSRLWLSLFSTLANFFYFYPCLKQCLTTKYNLRRMAS